MRAAVIVPLLLLLSVTCPTSGEEEKRQILPADSYQILGRAGFRRLGVCNFTYAWLTPPPGSSLDAYGHALACTRLQLDNGRLVGGQSMATTPTGRDGSTADLELGKVDKTLTATMVNLSRLDALMRADEAEIDGSSNLIYPGVQREKAHLADTNRFFYLADRIGNMNIMAVMRPGQSRSKCIKFEIIDPVSAEHALTPQHVLCSRKQCSFVPSDEAIKEIEENQLTKNTTLLLTTALGKAERHGQTLYMQLIVSRVACALLGVLSIVFAVTSLILCTRLRTYQSRTRKAVPHSETTIICEPQSPASCYRINGIGPLGPNTADHFTENSLSQGGFVHLPADTVSLKNTLMSTSSISACDGNYPGSMQYNSVLGHIPGPLPAYSLGGSHSTRYSEAGGLFTLVPIPSRGSIVSNTRSIVFPCQNEGASPIPTGPALNDTTPLVYRSESLGRNSRPREGGRRQLLLKPARQVNCIRPSGQVAGLLPGDAVSAGQQCMFNPSQSEFTTSKEWHAFNQFPQHTPLMQPVSNEPSPQQKMLVTQQYPRTSSALDHSELKNRSTPGIVKTTSHPD